MRTKSAVGVTSEFARRGAAPLSGRWVGHGLALLLLSGCAGPANHPSNAPVTSADAERQGPPSSPLLPVRSDDPSWGDALAPVTIVAFLDFECSFCAQVHPTLSELLKRYGPEQVRLVVKHAPLAFHERAVPAARAAQAVYNAAGSEPFLEYMGRLFEQSDSLSDASLLASAEQVGVSAESFTRNLRDPVVAAKVQDDTELAARLGVDGVPAFMVNGAAIVGARPFQDFETLIDHELRAAAELKRRGVAAVEIYTSRVQVNLDVEEQSDASSERPAFEQVAYQVPIGTSPSLGPTDAPVTIVEFADFECAYCRHAHQTVKALLEKYPGKIRWVMKHTPLPFHPAAVPAALTALEARRQQGDEAYWAALEQIYALEQLTPDALLAVADGLKLDASGLLKALEAQSLHPQLESDQALAMDLEAQGTPHFFINGRRMAGAQPLAVFEEIVNQELQKVSELKRDPTTTATIYQTLQQSAHVPPGLVRHDIPSPAPTAPSWGDADAPVTIQMFADMECGYCRRVLPTLAALKKQFPGKVRVVWRHLPLPFHKQARQAAAAALEASAQLGDHGFWVLTARLLGVSPQVFDVASPTPPAQPTEASDLSVESLTEHAKALGLDMARFRDAMNEGRHLAAIEQDQELARTLGVNGTPAFFVNGYALSGAQPFHRFERLVRLALEPQPSARR